MKQFLRHVIAEAHRRSLWQVLSIYLIGSWAAYQVIEVFTERVGLPDWVPPFAIVLFVIGLPIVLATAFVQEGLPGQAPPEEPGALRDPTLMPEFEPLAPAPAVTPTNTRARTDAPREFLTWHRSILAGIVAFLLLGVTAGSYLGLREAGVGPFASLISSGALAERDQILVAPLVHATGDTLLADALTEALRVDLSQSPVMNVVQASAISATLARMGRSADARLTPELAREVALREGAEAVLEGQITRAGSAWLITTRLVHAGSGEALASVRETASGDDDIIAAIDRLSKKLRETVGESLRTVRADPPLAAVTTPSLAALQFYTQGAAAFERGERERGIELLNAAIAEDSTFAMAWRKLAVAYNNTFGGRERVTRAATRAYELRNRLTDRERYHTTGFYEMYVTQDLQAGVRAYESLLELYPDDTNALNNLAGAYGRMRNYDRAAELYARAIALDSTVPGRWHNLVLIEFDRGRPGEAARLLEETRVRFPQLATSTYLRVSLANARRDHRTALALVDTMIAASRGSAIARSTAHFSAGMMKLAGGRIAAAQRHFDQAEAADIERGAESARQEYALYDALIEAYYRSRPEEAVRKLDATVSGPIWSATPPVARQYASFAVQYALLGRTDRARSLLAEFAALPASERVETASTLAVARAVVNLADQPSQQTTEALRAALDLAPCTACGVDALARAYEAAALPDSAIATWRRFIDAPQMVREYEDAWGLPFAYERLAELYETRGDVLNARAFASKFIELWVDADPELRPRVARMQALLQRLAER